MARGIKSFADDVLGIDPGGGGIVGSVKNIADDVLGIDPSGQGLVGSIRDNPRTAALLGTLGIGSLLYGGLGGLGSAVTGGLKSAGSALGGLGLGGLLGGVAPYAIGAGLGRSGLLGGGAREPQPQLQDFGGAPIGQSAFDYARSIAGGMPFEQVVQPGREFSLESPMSELVAPQAQVPAAPVTKLFSGIDASIGGYRDPSERLGDVERFIGPDGRDLRPYLGIDPYERLRVEEDIFGRVGDDFRPTEIRGPGGDIFGGPLGPGGRLAELFGIKDKGQDDGVYVGGSRDFREYDPLKDPFAGARAPEIDPFRDGVRPTEIFRPGGEIIGPAGSSEDLGSPLISNMTDDLMNRMDPEGARAPLIDPRDQIRPTEIFGPGGEIIGPMGRMSDVQPRSDQEIIDLIEGRLGEYQPVIPQPDLSGFARLSDIPSFVPRTDEEIRGLIGEGIAGIPTPAQFDPSGLQRRLAALEGREIPQFDPSGLLGRIGGLERQLGEITQFDPSGILSRLSALEAQGEPRYTQPGTEKDILPPKSPLGKLSLFG